MLFNSYAFLFVFLPIALLGFHAAGRLGRQAAIGWLGIASLVFYGWWSWLALPLLLASIAVNFGFGRLIVAASDETRKRVLLAVSVAINLGVLAWFKYANFFLQTLGTVAGPAFGGLEPLHVVLPIGISFFTFTQIAFLVDCRQGKVREPRFVHYLLFVSYFPHLIAGPLLHHAQLMPQFDVAGAQRPRPALFAAGVALFTIGLAKKVLIADPNGILADGFFDAPGNPDFVSAWHGTLAYTFQIYFDFSGYSDMALGLSLLFGIRLPVNFDSPYRATSIVEFWRRWHMTLSAFLRDYLYVPLGGNRRGPGRRYANLLVTMLLGGLWHGANWTYVVWGAMHGAFLVVAHVWRTTLGRSATGVPLGRAIGWLLTFTAVCLAWVFFRSQTLAEAVQILLGMGGRNGFGWHRGNHDWVPVAIAAVLATLPWNSNHIAARVEALSLERWSAVAGGIAIGALLAFSTLRIVAPGAPQFLYFQF